MKIIVSIFLVFCCLSVFSQEIFPLYENEIPNSKPHDVSEETINKDGELFGYKKVVNPVMVAYFPDKKVANGSAILICPGGGYGMESYVLEGVRIAESMNKQGVTAFILKYRLPSSETMKNTAIGPLQDAQQAMMIIRQQADEWNLDTHKIGVMGFSAGGHLAATVGTQFNKSYVSNAENINLRPDFMVLVYPVISMKDGLTHEGSRNNLLGKNFTWENVKLFSNEDQITKDTPPTWITHTGDDTVVPVDNSILFYQSLIKNGVNAEMHLYPTGNHGFVLHMDTEEWMQPLYKWMTINRMIE